MNLNPKQKEVVEHTNGSLLVMSPVGTGKTSTIARRAMHAIEKGIKPENILCLSFTNRAAKEMKNRIMDLAGVDAKEIMTRTFHSFCAFISRYEADWLGIDSDFTIYDEEDIKEIFSEISRKLGIQVGKEDADRFYGFLISFVQDVEIAPFLGNCSFDISKHFKEKLEYTWFKYFNKGQSINPERILSEYSIALSDNHALDFHNLIVNVLKLFEENPAALDRWQKMFNWIQVDEVQDVTVPEYKVISYLARKHKNLAFFGDIDQTIYEWRGSEPLTIIKYFKKEFSPVKEVFFVRNYRSTQTILKACRSVIHGYSNAVTKDIEPFSDKTGEKIILGSAYNIEDESKWIAGKLKSLKVENNESFNKMAILTRTNSSTIQISEVLEKNQIPHYLVDHFKFFRRAEIKDAIAYLRFLTNPFDQYSFERILGRPPKGIGNDTISEIIGLKREVGIRLSDFVNPAIYTHADPFGPLLEKWVDCEVVVFDTETTGLNPFENEIIEIAAVKVGVDGVIGKFQKYIKNTEPVGDSVKVHGYTNEFLAKNGEPASSVLKSFLEFSKGCVLVGHNIHFDLSFLKIALRRSGAGMLGDIQSYDTLDLTRRFYHFRKYSLSEICKELNIPSKPTHKAMDDVKTTYLLLRTLLLRLFDFKSQREQTVIKYHNKFKTFSEMIKRWRTMLDTERPPLLLEDILKTSGLLDDFAKRQDGQKRIDNLNELARLFNIYDDGVYAPPESLVNIMNIVSLGNDTDRYLQNDDRVYVLTVHQAKGLEFDTVFIADASDDKFPSFNAKKENRIEEEHRLFYVAMTRAKTRLIITYNLYNQFNRKQSKSRFLEFLSPDIFSEYDLGKLDNNINCKEQTTVVQHGGEIVEPMRVVEGECYNCSGDIIIDDDNSVHNQYIITCYNCELYIKIQFIKRSYCPVCNSKLINCEYDGYRAMLCSNYSECSHIVFPFSGFEHDDYVCLFNEELYSSISDYCDKIEKLIIIKKKEKRKQSKAIKKKANYEAELIEHECPVCDKILKETKIDALEYLFSCDACIDKLHIRYEPNNCCPDCFRDLATIDYHDNTFDFCYKCKKCYINEYKDDDYLNKTEILFFEYISEYVFRKIEKALIESKNNDFENEEDIEEDYTEPYDAEYYEIMEDIKCPKCDNPLVIEFCGQSQYMVHCYDEKCKLDTFHIFFDSDNKCPKCNNMMEIRNGRNGTFRGCKGYPDCNYTARSVGPVSQEDHNHIGKQIMAVLNEIKQKDHLEAKRKHSNIRKIEVIKSSEVDNIIKDIIQKYSELKQKSAITKMFERVFSTKNSPNSKEVISKLKDSEFRQTIKNHGDILLNYYENTQCETAKTALSNWDERYGQHYPNIRTRIRYLFER